VPSIKTGGERHFGQALTRLKEIMDNEIVKSAPSIRGDFKPYIFALVSGESCDTWETAADHFLKNGYNKFVLFVVNEKISDNYNHPLFQTKINVSEASLSHSIYEKAMQVFDFVEADIISISEPNNANLPPLPNINFTILP
jgi:uncharacterized protein YegL